MPIYAETSLLRSPYIETPPSLVEEARVLYGQGRARIADRIEQNATGEAERQRRDEAATLAAIAKYGRENVEALRRYEAFEGLGGVQGALARMGPGERLAARRKGDILKRAILADVQQQAEAEFDSGAGEVARFFRGRDARVVDVEDDGRRHRLLEVDLGAAAAPRTGAGDTTYRMPLEAAKARYVRARMLQAQRELGAADAATMSVRAQAPRLPDIPVQRAPYEIVGGGAVRFDPTTGRAEPIEFSEEQLRTIAKTRSAIDQARPQEVHFRTRDGFYRYSVMPNGTATPVQKVADLQPDPDMRVIQTAPDAQGERRILVWDANDPAAIPREVMRIRGEGRVVEREVEIDGKIGLWRCNTATGTATFLPYSPDRVAALPEERIAKARASVPKVVQTEDPVTGERRLEQLVFNADIGRWESLGPIGPRAGAAEQPAEARGQPSTGRPSGERRALSAQETRRLVGVLEQFAEDASEAGARVRQTAAEALALSITAEEARLILGHLKRLETEEGRTLTTEEKELEAARLLASERASREQREED